MDKAKDQLIALSVIILVSVATAHAQRNRDLKHEADDIRAARELPNYTPPPAEPCKLSSKTCKPKNALELSRACEQLGVIASLTSLADQESVKRCRQFGFWPGEKLRL
jgi:hypothetical protein